MGIEEFVLERERNEGIEIGEKRERKKNKTAFVKELLTESSFTVEKIAAMVKEPVSFVLKIKTAMK